MSWAIPTDPGMVSATARRSGWDRTQTARGWWDWWTGQGTPTGRRTPRLPRRSPGARQGCRRRQQQPRGGFDGGAWQRPPRAGADFETTRATGGSGFAQAAQEDTNRYRQQATKNHRCPQWTAPVVRQPAIHQWDSTPENLAATSLRGAGSHVPTGGWACVMPSIRLTAVRPHDHDLLLAHEASRADMSIYDVPLID